MYKSNNYLYLANPLALDRVLSLFLTSKEFQFHLHVLFTSSDYYIRVTLAHIFCASARPSLHPLVQGYPAILFPRARAPNQTANTQRIILGYPWSTWRRNSTHCYDIQLVKIWHHSMISGTERLHLFKFGTSHFAIWSTSIG